MSALVTGTENNSNKPKQPLKQGFCEHWITLQDMQTFKSYASLSCDAPPDKSKQLRLIHVIYENDGIVAGNVWVSTINP